MIRIRYRDSNEFSPGLHAAAGRYGRTTTLYLLSGLTVPERRSALRRLRLSARMGHGPRLPAAQLAIALLADGIRTAIGRAGAVFRLHPAGSTVPVMVLSGGAIAFLLLSAVSIRVLPPPGTDAQSLTSAAAVPVARSSHGRVVRLAGPGGPDQPGSVRMPQTQPGPPSRAGADGGQDRGAGSRGGQGTGRGSGMTLSEDADPTPAAAPPSPEAAAPSASALEPAPGTTPGPSAICVNAGPLGVCLGS